MNSIPSVSIVVPLYNKEHQIARCLDSLRRQSYENYEVLVVDDGSTDDSYNLAKQFESETIKVYRKDNGGVSSARNYGLDLAQGEFVVFVDSDDWVDNDYIKDFFKLGSYPRKAIGIQAIENVENDVFSIQDNYVDQVFNKSELSNAIKKYKLLHSGYPFGKLYRLSIIREHSIRFNEALPTHEDHVFVLNYFQYIESIILISNANYKYVISENNSSLSKKLYTPDIFLKASDALIAALDNVKSRIPISPDYYKRAKTDFGLSQRLRAILSAYIKNQESLIKKQLLKQELKTNKKLYKDYKSKRLIQDWIVKLLTIAPLSFVHYSLISMVKILSLEGKDVRLYIN